MNILYFGIESRNWVLNLMNEIAKLGHTITVFTQSVDDYDTNLTIKLEKGITDYTIPFNDFHKINFFEKHYNKINKQKFDIVMGSHAPSSGVVQKIKNELNIPGVIMVLDIPTDFMSPFSQDMREKLRWESWQKWFPLLKDMDMLIFNTTIAREEFKRYTGIKYPKENVIFYAVNTKNFDYIEKNHSDYIIKDKYVLTSCRLNKLKRNKIVIQALHILEKKYGKKLKYLAMGRADGDLNNLINGAKKLKVDFVYKGLIPEYGKCVLIRNCQALIYAQTTKYIGGLSPFEALYAGKKAFVSNVPVLHELYSDSAYYFEPENPEDLADQLNKYLDKKDSKKEIEKRKQRTIEYASYDVMAKKIIERLKTLKR